MSVSPQKVFIPEELTPHQIYTQGIATAMASNADISLSDLRALTQCVLMECLVRKVTPDFFATMLEDAVEFLTHLARLEAAVHAKNALMLAEPDRGEPQVLEAAISKLMPQIRDLRLKIAENTSKMVLCRDEGVTVS